MLEVEARERQLATLKQNTPLGKKLTNGVSDAPEPRQADDSCLVNELTKQAHENEAASHAAKYAHTNRTYDCGVPQGRQVKREKSAGPSGEMGEHGAGKRDIFPRGITFWRQSSS